MTYPTHTDPFDRDHQQQDADLQSAPAGDQHATDTLKAMAERLAAQPVQASPAPAQQLTPQAALIGKVMSMSAASGVVGIDHGANMDQLMIGSMVKIKNQLDADVWVYASVRELVHTMEGSITAMIDFVGQSRLGKFDKGLKNFPSPGAAVYATDDTDLSCVYFEEEAKNRIAIGKVYPTETVQVALKGERLLSRHFAILGSTGSGKSCTVSLLMHRLVEQNPAAHILVLDPHGEYGRAFADNGVHFCRENLSLPYWLMNFEEHVEILVGADLKGREEEVDILKRVLFAARKRGAGEHSLTRLTVDTPIPYKLTELLKEIDDELGRMDKAEDVKPFLRLKGKIEELRNDRRFAFMFSGLLVQDTLSDLVKKIMRMPTEGKPISTLDLSGVPTEVVDVVVSILSRLVFDYALWSTRTGNGMPLLLVCEEAHRYVPNADLKDRAHAARKSLERIAKEGRKYGVSLGLVSQRPADLSESILSQCGTIISMRMNNEKDRRFVASAMPEGSEHFLAALPSLQNREAIIVGEGARCPVRVKLDFLEDHQQPASHDPEFSLLWREDIDGTEEIVDHTVKFWRQGA